MNNGDQPSSVKTLINTLKTIENLVMGKSVVTGIDRMILRLIEDELERAKIGAS